MTTKAAHTPGAMRAAWQMTKELDVREMAEIIDRETAAPEMLDACSYAFVDISAVLLATEWELAPAVRAQLQQTADKCEAAIQKARGQQ